MDMLDQNKTRTSGWNSSSGARGTNEHKPEQEYCTQALTHALNHPHSIPDECRVKSMYPATWSLDRTKLYSDC
eukprot:3456339-Pyramimonas_sp.AAC.1